MTWTFESLAAPREPRCPGVLIRISAHFRQQWFETTPQSGEVGVTSTPYDRAVAAKPCSWRCDRSSVRVMQPIREYAALAVLAATPLLVASCGRPTSVTPAESVARKAGPPAEQGDTPVAKPASPQLPNSPAAGPTPPSFYTDAELAELGTEVTAEKLLLCRRDNHVCTCHEPLPCKEGECGDFEAHVREFRKALAAPKSGRTVYCERAEIGVCGAFRYFLFIGDIERYETLWFDQRGLVGQGERTDYNRYCNGKASGTFRGKIPKCDKVVRTELICGAGKSDPSPPLERMIGPSP
jgi:hypothetical protein